MAKVLLSDHDFIEEFRKLGPTRLADKVGIRARNVMSRRTRIERRLGVAIMGPGSTRKLAPAAEYPHRAQVECPNGTVIVAGDAHYWPGPAPLMHRALVRFCKELKPRAIIFNGDALDFPQISRHAPIGWEKRPTLAEEIENGKDRLHEVEVAAFKAEKIWTLGNHDARFETRLATVAPEYAKINGVHLHDSFPNWKPAWSAWINDDVVVKHRFRAGIHAPWNNTIYAGKTIVTGHLHSAKIIPFTDYNGTRYGVDAGCIADTDHRAFVDYTEDNPKNWRSAFCVLTFRNGRLLQPELVLKYDAKRVEFRGELITP